MPSALASLLSPVTEEQFFTEHFEKAPLMVHRGDAEFFRHVLSEPDLDYVVTSACRAGDGVELLQGGASATIPELKRETDPSRVQWALRRGATVRVRDVEKAWKPVWDLCEELSAGLQFSVTANLYCTPPQSQGLQRHFDYLDVLILQVAGKKHWRVYSADRELPVLHAPAAAFASRPEHWDWPRLRPTAKPRLLLDCDLEAGDLLYMPRGFGHEAATGGLVSAHLTLALHSFSWMHVAEVALAAYAQTSAGLRKSIRTGDEQAIRAVLQDFAATADLRAAREILLKAYARTRRELPSGSLTDFDAADSIVAGTELELRTGIAPVVLVSSESVSLAFGDRTVHFAADAERALRFVLAERRFRVSDLPGLTDAARLEFCRQLHRGGAARIIA